MQRGEIASSPKLSMVGLPTSQVVSSNNIAQCCRLGGGTTGVNLCVCVCMCVQLQYSPSEAPGQGQSRIAQNLAF